MADTESDKYLRWLKKQAGKERHALFVHALDVLSVSAAEAARIAGYGAGTSDDPDEQERQLVSAASRAVRTKAIERLRTEFEKFRRDGDKSPVASEAEILERLSHVLRTSTDSSIINAATRLLEHHRRTPEHKSARTLPAVVTAACASQSPLIRLCGVGSAKFYQKHGQPDFRDWQPPESCSDLAGMMKSAGLTSAAVALFLGGTDE